MKRNDWVMLIPYGIWTCESGRQVLFNRGYCPILERDGPDAPARAANPKEWVSFKDQKWFFSDSDTPWGAFVPARQRRKALARVLDILESWGVPDPPKMPRRQPKDYYLPNYDQADWSTILRDGRFP